jgi:hypothetical protein
MPDVEHLPLTGDLANFGRSPETRLPVVVGRSSLGWVSRWILEKRELPPKNAVRVEELINSASLPRGEALSGLGLAIETMKCPWHEVSQLITVQLHAEEEELRDLVVNYRSDAERRVLGSFAIRGDAALPTVLPAGRSNLVMLEIRSSGSDHGDLSIGQGDVTTKHSVPSPLAEPSAGMRHSALMAGFGLWLRDEGVTSRNLRKMLDGSADDPDPVRAEVRRVVREALELSKAER